MREGGLDAPTRHVIPWEEPEFFDRTKTEAEMRRIFDICHGCRRCFNLCDAFPRLFDLVDNSDTGELDGVAVSDYQKVADACTLCDMCFMTKCPYVPPHEFNVDFPHIMLRYRAVEFHEGRVPWARTELGKTDRNGELARYVAPLANWVSDRHNQLTRPALEKVTQVDRNAALPKYHGRTFVARSRRAAPPVTQAAPASGRKAVLYATCFRSGKTDRNGELARYVAPLANWVSDRHNQLTRPALEKVTQVDRNAALPKYHGRTFVARSRRAAPPVTQAAPASGRKAVLYATCF